MIFQTTKGIDKDLKSWGCYFLSLLRIYEKVAKIELDVDTVNMIYRLCRQVGYIGPEAFIKTGGVKGIAQIASAVTTKGVYMVLDDDHYNYTIGRWSRRLDSGKPNSHFVLMSQSGDVEYDPWPNSKTVREGKLMDERKILAEVV